MMIRTPRIRVIGADGGMLGVMSADEGRRQAQAAGLDLVEISPLADPPVCKILDYGKFRYEQQKKRAEAKKKQRVIVVKEIKMRPGIEEHDFEVKKRAALRFLEAGDKIKLTVRFRGRELARQELGVQVLRRFVESLGDAAQVESEPQSEGCQMVMVVTPQRQKS